MKALVKDIAHFFGIEITHYRPASSDAQMVQTLLSNEMIDLVFDVGANVGQYANALRQDGYGGKIVSFEPLAHAYDQLKTKSTGDADWVIAPRSAIGNQNGQIEINISENSVSSSILHMQDRHVEAAPGSAYVGAETVAIKRLDSIAKEYFNAGNSIYLKVDTQGYEESVLDGATDLLQVIKAVQLEVSLVPLYEGQLLFVEMVTKMDGLGFDLFSILPGFKDPATGQLLQTDCIFLKKELMN